MIPCTFVSVWDDGDVVCKSRAEYDPKTGEIHVHEMHDPNVEILEREYLEVGDEELEVCPCCHEYVLKTVMVGDTSLEETKECPNPDCENKA